MDRKKGNVLISFIANTTLGDWHEKKERHLTRLRSLEFNAVYRS